MLKTPESFHPQSQPHRDPTGNYRALAQSLTRDFGCSKKALEFTLLLEASFGTTNKSWPTALQFPEDPIGTERRPLGRVLHRPAKVYELCTKAWKHLSQNGTGTVSGLHPRKLTHKSHYQELSAFFLF